MEAGESSNDGDEGFLGGVLPVGIVAREAPADGVDLALVAPQQIFEGTPVSGLCGLGESGVVEIVANLQNPCACGLAPPASRPCSLRSRGRSGRGSAWRAATRFPGQPAGTW